MKLYVTFTSPYARLSLISLQLPAAPMMVFPIRLKLANVAPVQCPRDTDASKHRRAARRRNQDQGFHRRLPLRRRVRGLRKLGDVLAGVLKGDEVATARQRSTANALNRRLFRKYSFLFEPQLYKPRGWLGH
jgi:hypothetical protein